MINSLVHPNEEHHKFPEADTAKILIINSNGCDPHLINRLQKISKDKSPGQKFFGFAKITLSDKILNIYECTENLCDSFLSERNLVIITFKLDGSSEESECKSIMERILKVANKNILPVSIMILSLGTCEEQVLKNISTQIISAIDKLQGDLKSSIDGILEKYDSMKTNEFHVKVQISHQMNMKNQLECLKGIINFSAIDLTSDDDTNFTTQLIQISPDEMNEIREHKLNEYLPLLEKSIEELNSLTKKDMMELKMFHNPPVGIQISGEAVCILFGLKPEWNQFKKLYNNPTNLMEKLMSYDIGSISDVQMEKLKPYIDNPEFVKEIVKKSSQAAGPLCNWVRNVYAIKLCYKELEKHDKLGISSSFSSLSGYMVKNAYYMFCWPVYLPAKFDKKTLAPTQNVKIQKEKVKSLTNEKFIGTQDYLEQYSDVLLDEKENNSFSERRKLSEKFSLAESANGNIMWNIDQQLMITDPIWFADFIKLFTDSKVKSSEYKDLADLIGSDIVIGDYQALSENLEKEIPKDKVNGFLEYIGTLSLFKMIENIGENKIKIILPMFQLGQKSSKDLAKIWPVSWTGHEYAVKFELFTPLVSQGFYTILKLFFDMKQTVSIWQHGLVNRDCACDIQILHDSTSIKLAVRTLDHEKQLNLKNTPFAYFAKAIYMEYYFIIKYVLNKYSIAYKINLENYSKHSISVDLPTDPSPIELNNSIAISDLDFLSKYFKCLHKYTAIDKKCVNCTINLDLNNWLSDAYKTLYHDETTGPSISKLNKEKRIQFSFKNYMSLDTERLLKMKLIEFKATDTKDFQIVFEIENSNSRFERLTLNLTNQTYNIEGIDGAEITTKVMRSYLRTSKSEENTEFTAGECVSVLLEKLDENQNSLSVYYMANQLIQVSIQNESNLFTEIKIDCTNSEKGRNGVYLNYCFQDAVSFLYDDLISLVNHRLEAVDKLNPKLLCVATIADVRPSTNEVLIHFDGWTNKYDYWTDKHDTDLRPAGFSRSKATDNKGLRFQVPKNFDGSFIWEEYLDSCPAVPFEFFTKEQTMNMPRSDLPRPDYKNQFRQKNSDKILCKNETALDPRGHIHLVKEKFLEKCSHFIQTEMNEKAGKQDNFLDRLLRRGMVLMPFKFSTEFLEMPNLLFNNHHTNLSIHMPCIHLQRPEDQKIIYAHFLDCPSYPVKPNLLNRDVLLLCLVTYYALANSENSLIMPFFEKIFHRDLVFIKEMQITLKQLNEKMRNYFASLFEAFCLCFSRNELDKIQYSAEAFEDIKKDKKSSIGLKPSIKPAGKNKKIVDGLDELMPLIEKEPLLFNFKGSICSYCSVAKECPDIKSPNQLLYKQYKIKNAYSKCCMDLVLPLNESPKPYELDEAFSDAYSNLKSFSCFHEIHFENEEKFFKKFKKLQRLELSNNGLTTLPPSISKLKSLKWMSIRNNEISFSNVIDCFKKLSNLSNLKLENLKFDINKDNLVKIPKSLKKLRLTSYKQNYIPFDLEGSELTDLTCTGVRLISVNSSSKTEALNLSKVAEFYSKIFNEKQIEELFMTIHGSKSEYLDSTEANQLNAFIFKKFPRMGDDVVINEEQELKLEHSGIPETIFQVHTLRELNFSFQAIRIIPGEIKELVNLNKLILESCILLRSISPELSKLPITHLNVNNCYSLKTPPPEIQNRGLTAMMTYLRGLSTGSVACKRTKLMLVGLGEAGKTSLLNALRGNTNKSTVITDGINIQDWKVDLPDKTTLVYSMWDFAGQSVYYNTHQFFLSSRAVYILVWNVRLGSEYAGLDFWLSSISCHAPGAPIFIVGTHIDQVANYFLNEDGLKEQFPQIAGFHFVSSHTGEGIEKFSARLVEVTLQQKYIGELVPQLWFNFEKSVRDMSKTRFLISYTEMVSVAEASGLFDEQEVLQGIRFLADLGSVQYFETTGLKDKIVINPQWIVDVMACIVSVQKTCIIEGRLKHSDIGKVWSNYDSSLHEWMLKLTEEFDLTFFVASLNISIVPCLLPEIQPSFEWPELQISNNTNTRNKVKEYQVVYSFGYIPAGLFNRVQVRLFNYADSSTIWKNGSLLHKNGHLALIKKMKNLTIHVKVHGTKPENIIFIIHEVIETLINESYHGIQYDYSFPCPECVEGQFSDACLFSGALLRRANDYKAPFLQCNKYFHAISIQEMMSVMPVGGTSTLDLNLGQSLRDLKQLKKNLKYDVLFWYCDKDTQCKVNPVDVINKLVEVKAYKIWYPKNPANTKIDKLTSALKEAKLVILGISDNFARDEKCMQVYELVKNIIKTNYLIVEFGETHKWTALPALLTVSTDVRVIMQDPARFKVKMNECIESIERNIIDVKTDQSLEASPPDVFISYCWKNSHDAISKGSKKTETSLGWLDPRNLVEYFKENDINAWIDVEDVNSSNLFGEITKGLNQAKCVVACFSDEYVTSANCALEFRYAHMSLKLPIIKAIVGTGNKWRKNELAFLSGGYDELNFQYKNKDSYPLLLEFVQKTLASIKDQEDKEKPEKEKDTSNEDADNNSSAFQELYELTQRKFLSQLTRIAASMQTPKKYPRLFCLDLMEKHKLDALAKIDKTRKSDEEKADNETSDQRPVSTAEVSPTTDTAIVTKLIPCIRVLCEAEDGWHLCSTFVTIEEVPKEICSYLSRIMNILKSGSISNQMNIFSTDQGLNLIKDIENKSFSDDKDVPQSYIKLREYFINHVELDNSYYSFDMFTQSDIDKMSLKRCELKNHKILWLCKSHIEQLNPKVLSDSVKGSEVMANEGNYQILEELNTLKMELFEKI